MLTTMVLALSLAAAPQAAQNAALKIVVLEGEAGVNIIQQKTAVKPVVEVRDRNNLPIPGVLVTFSIEGGKAATFGGASTLTVATNAAGQAAVSSLTPASAGAFHIQVSAAFQGQLATTTIAQTNVMTAAQAAAAAGTSAGSGSSAGAGGGAGSGAGGGAGAGGAGGGSASGAAAGGAAGAGGGLSATTIAIAGAAVAGGAVAVTQVADKASSGGETKFVGTFSGTISGTVTGRDSCSFTYTISGADARLRFEQFSDSAVKGIFEYQGPSSLTSSTCQFSAPPIPQFIGSTDLTGTPSNFGGKRTITPSAGTENNYIFQGSISGSSATGTFTYEQRSTNADGAGGTVTMVAIGTFPITFQKQ